MINVIIRIGIIYTEYSILYIYNNKCMSVWQDGQLEGVR